MKIFVFCDFEQYRLLKFAKFEFSMKIFKDFFSHTCPYLTLLYFYLSGRKFQGNLDPIPFQIADVSDKMANVSNYQLPNYRLNNPPDKVKSVKEAFIRCLAVHTLKFEILKPARKTKQQYFVAQRPESSLTFLVVNKIFLLSEDEIS